MKQLIVLFFLITYFNLFAQTTPPVNPTKTEVKTEVKTDEAKEEKPKGNEAKI